jgi:RimJ/RimL family protein N-acetyltransferase
MSERFVTLFEMLKGRSPLAFLKKYVVRIPYTLTSGDIHLRRFRFSDYPFLIDGLTNQGTFPSHELHKPVFFLWPSVWWWIKTTFTVMYCIEFRSRRVGFIGLYNLELGKSSEITLVIFRREHRRYGYGSKAFSLLAGYLKNHDMLDTIIVKTEMANLVALTFWQKLGFKEDNVSHKIVKMHIDLNEYPSGSGDTSLLEFGLLPEAGKPWQ